jgi:hypothetical protein
MVLFDETSETVDPLDLRAHMASTNASRGVSRASTVAALISAAAASIQSAWAGRAEGLDIASRTLLLRGLAAMAEVPLAAPTKARSAVVVDFAPEEERQQLDSHQQAAREAVANAAGALFPSLQLLWAAVPPPLPQGAPAATTEGNTVPPPALPVGTQDAKDDVFGRHAAAAAATALEASDTLEALWAEGDALNPLLSLLVALQRSTAAHAVLLWSLVCRADVSGSAASRVEVTMDGLLAVGGVASADVLDGADAQAATAEIEASLGANTLTPATYEQLMTHFSEGGNVDACLALRSVARALHDPAADDIIFDLFDLRHPNPRGL